MKRRSRGPARRGGVTACGLMSGTSRDGIDVAIVEITGRFPENKIGLTHYELVRYPAHVSAALKTRHTALDAAAVAALDFEIGRCFGLAALGTIERAGLAPRDVAFIGSHGQTLAHFPAGVTLGRRRIRSTLQVGNGAVIAQATGIPTVADFRSADIAVGGEGAPLVPIYDYVVLRSGTKSRVALNIGGIANLTAIPRGARPAAVLSFDTGPGNSVLDLAVGRLTRGRVRYDRDGAMARGGNLDSRRLRQMLAHPYFTRKPPKSTGWEEFGEDFTDRLLAKMKPGRGGRSADVMRTLTEAVAESIARAVQDFVAPAMRPDEVLVTGGGSRNTFLVDCLRERLTTRFPAIAVEPGEAFGINSDAKEACAFAYLAYLCLQGIPANLASQAAGLKPAVLGAIYPGSYPGPGPQTCKCPAGPANR